MPNNVVKAFAKKSGKTVAEVEKIWDETKKETKKKFAGETPPFWAYVNNVVQRKLGILKEHMTFKDYLNEGWFPTEEIKAGDIVQLIKGIKGVELTAGETYTVVDVSKNGDLKINNDLGIEWSETYFDSKKFKKFN